MTAAPVGDDETRIPHPATASSSARMDTSARFPTTRLLPRYLSKNAGVVCCACLVGIEHGPCGDCAYCPRSSPCRALMIFIQHATWCCVASSGAAGAAGHSVTGSRRGRTTRNKHPFENVPFVNTGAQIRRNTLVLDNFLIILQHTLLLDNFLPTSFMMAQFSLPIKTKRHSIANLLACTRSDCNARLGAFFHASARYLPETKTTATPIAMSCYY